MQFAGLAEKGMKAEDVGRVAAESLLEALATGGCVDEWLQDQLVVFMALASGRCCWPYLTPSAALRYAAVVAQAC